MEKIKLAGGVLLVCDKKCLLVKRSSHYDYPNVWAVVGGGVEPGETSLIAIKRELKEETQISSENINFKFFERQTGMNRPFDFYIGYCKKEYPCVLDYENQDWGWFNMSELPKPLFSNLHKSLKKILK